jgi:hypothetical protein
LLPNINYFFYICVMGEHIILIKSCFGIKTKIDFNKIPKILDATSGS